jgi:uncharacterized SAM-binding protein YcdF (DUF218 family)
VALDAIVLLGCRIGSDAGQWGAARRRADRAAQAWHQGAAPLVVVSGGRRWHGVVEADALCERLLAAQVPRHAIVLERSSMRTRDNACRVARLLQGQGIKHVGLVTCDWHLPRAALAFARAGFDVTGLPATSAPVGRWRRLLRSSREGLSQIVDSLCAGVVWRQ